MERIISPELPTVCGGDARIEQLEALVYSKVIVFPLYFFYRWECQRLPPPPFPDVSTRYHQPPPFTKIMSCAVLGGGSHVCISVQGHGAGTYCLDTATHAWSKLGDWVRPFHGKVEYVPELKLWLGFSGHDSCTLCASSGQLSPADGGIASCPIQLEHVGKELDPPGEWGWLPIAPEPVLVSLGSRRIGKYDCCGEQEEIERDFAVLTGVEVEGNGEGGCLRFIAHKSRRLSFTNGFHGIDVVF